MTAEDRPGTAAPLDLTARLADVTTVTEEHLTHAERAAEFPVAALGALRRTGLLGLLVPARYGGLGGAERELVTAVRSLGRSDLSVATVLATHCQQTAALVRHGSEPLREELLPRIAAGEICLAPVATEAGRDGHVHSSEAELGEEGGYLVIDGFVAPFVTGGACADGFLIVLRGPEAATASNEVSLVYAHRDQLDLTASGDPRPSGTRAGHRLTLHLAGRVPAHQLVGEHGAFHRIAAEVFGPLAHLGRSAACLGTAAGALSRVRRLLRSPAGRSRFDTGSELLLIRMSRSRRRLESVHDLLQQTLRTVESGADLAVPARQLQLGALSVAAAEECRAVVDDLIAALGLRHGSLQDARTRLELALRDLRAAPLDPGDDQLRRADDRPAPRDHQGASRA